MKALKSSPQPKDFADSSDQVFPTSGEVEQYARAGDGLSAVQPDFDAFFKDGTFVFVLYLFLHLYFVLLCICI